MTYDVRWMPRARRQAAEAQQWWLTNRELAPTMFLDELAREAELAFGVGADERRYHARFDLGLLQTWRQGA
jgi:hypothetical protein